jgi:hypothetical protein
MTVAGSYVCMDDLRSEAVRDSTALNGIDYLEVVAGQTKLEVHFLHPLPGQPDEVPAGGAKLNKNKIAILGGDRVRGIDVVETSTSGDVLTVTVSGPGDFSTYRLALVDPVTKATPAGFDPRLSEIDFSFKAGCPIRFDCAPRDDCPPEPDASDVRDYLAKDYDSFRQLMLDRMASTIPEWTERSPADQQVALIELLAFAADRLSYQQDATATEAYLATARRRVSVRRHARLLGYRMHEGCAARAFVVVDVDSDLFVAAGREFLTGPADDRETVVFTSLHDLSAKKDAALLPLHTWTDEQCCLPRGATGATLAGTPSLAPGQFLVLEEIAGPLSGEAPDADPAHRHVVRLSTVTPGADPLDEAPITEVTWEPADALPFPLTVSAVTTGPDGGRRVSACAVARGNVALVEHGRPVDPVRLSTDVDVSLRFEPRLPDGRPTYAEPYTGPARTQPAVFVAAGDPRSALPAITVADGDLEYRPVLDLLSSPPSAAEFVVEAEEDGSATLRFGDDLYGRRPDPDVPLTATYRLGHGPIGNVGPDAISAMVGDTSVVRGVRNPLPALGGVGPESMEKVRLDAPQAFRVQRRAVTDADYGVAAEQFPSVQRAAGRMRWTGSWYTAFVTVDRSDGDEVTPDFAADVTGFLDGYRMAGVDVEVAKPVPVALEIALDVCADDFRFASDVERDVLDVLSSRGLPDGRRGLFHPDNFTFGTSVYLSQVYAAVLRVPGVSTVRARAFRRYGEPDRGELAAGVLRVHDLEVAQLANDPDVPERGILTVSVAGGR